MNKLTYVLLCAVLLVICMSSLFGLAGRVNEQFALVNNTYWEKFYVKAGPEIIGSDYQTNCGPQIRKNQIAFPKSPIQPPLPPLNNNEYEAGGDDDSSGNYDCDNYADTFCQAMARLYPDVSCAKMRFDKQFVNQIQFEDERDSWTCFVEPQTNQHYCMKSDRWVRMNQKRWVKSTLCETYYRRNRAQCSSQDIYITPYVGDCAAISNACTTEKSEMKFGYCADSSWEGSTHMNPGFREVRCDCAAGNDGSDSCAWEIRTGDEGVDEEGVTDSSTAPVRMNESSSGGGSGGANNTAPGASPDEPLMGSGGTDGTSGHDAGDIPLES